MLVLSRQRDETIMIGDEIEITVVDVRGDKIRLGISAPARIAVHRKEVYEAIRRENEAAARFEGFDTPPPDGTPPSRTPGVMPGPAKNRSSPGARAQASPPGIRLATTVVAASQPPPTQTQPSPHPFQGATTTRPQAAGARQG